MQWKTPRVIGFSRANCSNTSTLVARDDGSIIIETVPSEFAAQRAAVSKCSAAASAQYAAIVQQQADCQSLVESVDSGTGQLQLRTYRADSAEACRIAAMTAAAIPPAGLNVGDTFTGRLAVTEFFCKRRAYADPEQYDDSSGCALPTREDLYAVRFINSEADILGQSIRVPLIYEVDQQSGLLAPLARIERSLVDDDFLSLNGWNVVNSASRPNRWQVGGLDGQTAAFVTMTSGANDYVPGTLANLSICHLYRDVYFPTDSPSGSVHLHLRILGNASVAQPTNDAQDFAAVHLVATTFTPQADTGVGFEHRLAGTMLVDRIQDNDYVTEELCLRTNRIYGSLAGQTLRLVVSFHSGAGGGVKPYALALSRLLVVATVQPPTQPAVSVSPCTQACAEGQ